MMKKTELKQIVLAFMCLVTIGGSLSAQTSVIDLWNGKIPGAKYCGQFKQMVDTAAGWVDKHSIVNPCLYFYPAPEAKATGTAVIICPGGAYGGLAIKHEGEQVAKWLNSLGISAFVLKYRLPDDSIMENKTIGPMQDGQRAIRLVRSHAKEWGINPAKIGIMGFSAGGHLASTLSTHYNEKVYESDDLTSARPDFSVLIYPVISMNGDITHWGSRINLLGNSPTAELVKHFSNELQVNAETPPAFMVHSFDDDAVAVQNSINYALALHKFQITCELHLYPSGKHGYGMGKSTNTESFWTEACRKWFETKDLLVKK
ncbi:MAG TPA: alpha/beta hydrolase [Paludibacter sp.]|nr:alpha/beta hydrolase [Paludibacter sp.]